MIPLQITEAGILQLTHTHFAGTWNSQNMSHPRNSADLSLLQTAEVVSAFNNSINLRRELPCAPYQFQELPEASELFASLVLVSFYLELPDC